jgi:hypothetical protein
MRTIDKKDLKQLKLDMLDLAIEAGHIKTPSTIFISSSMLVDLMDSSVLEDLIAMGVITRTRNGLFISGHLIVPREQDEKWKIQANPHLRQVVDPRDGKKKPWWMRFKK